MESALDIVALARSERAPVAEVARAYFELGVALGLDWLHVEIDRLAVDGSWQATARTGLRDAGDARASRAHPAGAAHARREARRRAAGALERGARRRARRPGSARSPKCAAWAPRISRRSPSASTRYAASRPARSGQRGCASRSRSPRTSGRMRSPPCSPASRASACRPTRSWSPMTAPAPRHAAGHRQRSSPARRCRARLVSQPHGAFAPRACAISPSPPLPANTSCSSTATCCCTRNSSPIIARIARRGFYTQGVRVLRRRAAHARAARGSRRAARRRCRAASACCAAPI